MKEILNIAGYRFTPLTDLNALQRSLQQFCMQHALMGTILLSEEGININLAGTPADINAFKAYLDQNELFLDIRFHESYSASRPFQALKVKVKKEIITFRQPSVVATDARAPSLSPKTLKAWLDEEKDMTLLDTRNAFEVDFGTFSDAIHLDIKQFGALPAAVNQLDKRKPVVMFCTGGIRCEKAAIYLQQQGFADVYQLDGGILGYFAQVGGEHYKGDCFVFDERVALEPAEFSSAAQ